MSAVMKSVSTTDIDVAVLQVQVTNIDHRLSEIKSDIAGLQQTMERNTNETRELLREVRLNADSAHAELSSKVSSLEKWRWMMMGAGVILGALGFDAIKPLFFH